MYHLGKLFIIFCIASLTAPVYAAPSCPDEYSVITIEIGNSSSSSDDITFTLTNPAGPDQQNFNFTSQSSATISPGNNFVFSGCVRQEHGPGGRVNYCNLNWNITPSSLSSGNQSATKSELNNIWANIAMGLYWPCKDSGGSGNIKFLNGTFTYEPM